MSSIRRERRDPLPLTWELPAVAALAWMGVAAMLLPAGRGAVSWLTGGGWVWPKTGADLTASLVGLLAGHPSAGLTAPASALPAAGVVYLLVAMVELVWLIVSLLVLRIWWRTWGPGMREGLADRAEVEKVLGLSRMRRNRTVIRPDLYAKPHKIMGRS
jgi:hypothetical protein